MPDLPVLNLLEKLGCVIEVWGASSPVVQSDLVLDPNGGLLDPFIDNGLGNDVIFLPLARTLIWLEDAPRFIHTSNNLVHLIAGRETLNDVFLLFVDF